MSATAPVPASPVVSRMPPAERGATRIADRVVAKIASQAAREVLRGMPRADLVPGERLPRSAASVRPPGRTPGSGPGTARVRLYLELGYPADLREVCAEVRRRVVERVGALANMDVPEVAVEIERLFSAAMAPDQGRIT